MDKYEELKIEVIVFEDADVITNSQDYTGEELTLGGDN